ncbi:hypothetical protein J4T94_gp110 [Mycobacterium phage Krypton555]|uniref:Uncharacterized protein n=1 Tax=Mycobacterium phage Krypton555 TaxID=2015885 RepID=A0A222ZRG3_9CAUD|nr:hypothetical protein J4T94_gp110 [Mycobacterium phage Krypton555]ASR87108.1 hypothetical protein KRYPTON555_72 [Mycobacterium phage Krypton555]
MSRGKAPETAATESQAKAWRLQKFTPVTGKNRLLLSYEGGDELLTEKGVNAALTRLSEQLRGVK